MKSHPSIRTLLAGAVFCVASSAALAAHASVVVTGPENRGAVIAELMQSWQQRIDLQNLPVDDPENWSLRNAAKFARLTDAQLVLARQAATLGELELLFITAPIPEGTRLDALAANIPGNITIVPAKRMSPGGTSKSNPVANPTLYSGLVFTAVQPCRLYDSRFSTAPLDGSPGTRWTANSTRVVDIGPEAGGYAFQGGQAVNCAGPLVASGQIAAAMTAVSTVNQAGAGYLVFFSHGATNPNPYGVAQWFQPGYVQTSFVVMPTDLSANVQADGFIGNAGSHVIVDVIGYFVKPTGGATVTSVSASAPLASSGGTAPDISLTGTVAVANGGTGQATLAANGILYGQGTAAVGTAVGVAGQVLAGTAGAPAWTGSPSLSGNFRLVNSTASAGNIMKGASWFIHNFGASNTFIGESAGNFTMTGGSNTASGSQALSNNTTGNNNTASGATALVSNTSGGANTASGNRALSNNTTGSSNTASGADALATNTIGNNNTASGTGALISNTIGTNNTASGHQALVFNTTGSNNIALGENAGFSRTTGNFNIDIGNRGVAGEGTTIRIGDANQTRTFITGIRAVNTLVGAITVIIDSSGQLGVVNSSRRFKDDIADMDAASSALMKLRPVTFHYKTDQNPSGRSLQYGLIAEEVAEVDPGLVAHSADDQVESVYYQFLAPMLVNEYQKQQRTIEMQASEMTRQGREMKQVLAELEVRTGELAKQRQIMAELNQDRQLQGARIDALETQSLEIAELKMQSAHMARLLDQLRRSDMVSTGLELK